MALELKYTEDDTVFEIEETFFEDLQFIGSDYVDDILKQMNSLCKTISDIENKIQIFGGVSNDPDQKFFEIGVLKEKGKHPFFLDIREISADDYLDYILLEKTILNRPGEKKNNSL
tara:strand:- start:1034 stop:1381 length:348 start_codon:yes stop_codon:yes gene_type:complete